MNIFICIFKLFHSVISGYKYYTTKCFPESVGEVVVCYALTGHRPPLPLCHQPHRGVADTLRVVAGHVRTETLTVQMLNLFELLK